MILKGNQRGGARQLALHLMNGEMNEHVALHEIRGFVSENIMGALNEAYAISKGTQAKQFMYSLSLNPPSKESVSTATFEAVIAKTEDKLGLTNQPRVIVFHEKEGRRHAHCVWSRIDSEKMKAINLSHDRTKLNVLSKSLYLEHGWHMPRGFREKRYKDPLNFTRAEWQQALRSGRKPKDIKRDIQEAFAISDNRKSFEAALKESGFYLARGDRRDVFVVVDLYGETHKLQSKLGLEKNKITERIGKVNALRTVAQIKRDIIKDIKPVFDKQLSSLRQEYETRREPLLQEKNHLKKAHQAERNALNHIQKERQLAEEEKRQARIQRGFKHFTSRITGRYHRSRKLNEKEAWQAHLRDQKERDALIAKQLTQRQILQEKLVHAEQEHTRNQQDLIRDLSQIKTLEREDIKQLAKEHWHEQERERDDFDHER